MSPHEYEALSREERLRRIGALFYKAVVISLARKQAEAEADSENGSGHTCQVAPAGAEVPETISLPEGDLALFRRYALLDEIAPRDATEFRGVSRKPIKTSIQPIKKEALKAS